jgi:tRNA U54 and U55 pseudouridine synthase Pus10
MPPGRLNMLEVCVDGESLGRFDIPVRSAANGRPLVVSLARYHGRQVTVELICDSRTEGSAIDWAGISLVGRTAIGRQTD